MSRAVIEQNILNEECSLGTPSVYSCPECRSVLWEIREGNLVRFRCRVGHAYTLEAMLAEQDETVEEGLWSVLNTLQEQASLIELLIEQTRQHNHEQEVACFEEKLQQIRQNLTLLKKMLLGDEGRAGEPG